MSVIVACKNEADPIKNEGARVATTLFIDFSDAQWQLTPKSVMKSCRNSNPRKLLWLILSPARMKKIHWKMKVLEWLHRFSHYKSMGIFSKRSRAANSCVLRRIMPNFEPIKDFMDCPRYLQE